MQTVGKKLVVLTMQMQRIIKAFVCVFTIAPLLSGGWTLSEVIPDMTKFLNTSDPIWSYMTTSTRRDYDCKVDIIDSIQGTKVLFRRFLGYRKFIMSSTIRAKTAQKKSDESNKGCKGVKEASL
nr:uncharacterized protein LOC119168445 [Rhipicephalus microplus]